MHAAQHHKSGTVRPSTQQLLRGTAPPFQRTPRALPLSKDSIDNCTRAPLVQAKDPIGTPADAARIRPSAESVSCAPSEVQPHKRLRKDRPPGIRVRLPTPGAPAADFAAAVTNSHQPASPQPLSGSSSAVAPARSPSAATSGGGPAPLRECLPVGLGQRPLLHRTSSPAEPPDSLAQQPQPQGQLSEEPQQRQQQRQEQRRKQRQQHRLRQKEHHQQHQPHPDRQPRPLSKSPSTGSPRALSQPTAAETREPAELASYLRVGIGAVPDTRHSLPQQQQQQVPQHQLHDQPQQPNHAQPSSPVYRQQRQQVSVPQQSSPGHTSEAATSTAAPVSLAVSDDRQHHSGEASSPQRRDPGEHSSRQLSTPAGGNGDSGGALPEDIGVRPTSRAARRLLQAHERDPSFEFGKHLSQVSHPRHYSHTGTVPPVCLPISRCPCVFVGIDHQSP